MAAGTLKSILKQRAWRGNDESDLGSYFREIGEQLGCLCTRSAGLHNDRSDAGRNGSQYSSGHRRSSRNATRRRRSGSGAHNRCEARRSFNRCLSSQIGEAAWPSSRCGIQTDVSGKYCHTLRRRGVGESLGWVPPSAASRLPASRAINASKPALTRAVVSCICRSPHVLVVTAQRGG